MVNLRITQHIRFGLSALALRDIAPFGRNVVYAGNVMRNIGILSFAEASMNDV